MPLAQRKRKGKVSGDKKEQEVKKNSNIQPVQAFRPFSVAIGFLLIFYLTYFYNKHSGEFGQFGAIQNCFYLANSSLLIASLGLLMQNSSIIALAISCASFSHVSWLYDIILWSFFDKQSFGRVSYLADTLTPSLQTLWPTTLHHLWFLPLCFVVLHLDYRMVGVKIDVWMKMCVINVLMSTISYFGFGNIHDGSVPDFNTGHEFWLISHAQSHTQSQHVSSPLPQILIQHQSNIIHKFDSSPFLIFLIWTFMVQSVLLNGTCFLLLKVFSIIFLEDHVSVITSIIDFFFGTSGGKNTSKKTTVLKTEHQN